MKTSKNPKSRTLSSMAAVIFLFALGGIATAATVTVDVAPGNTLSFSPAFVTVHTGDTVKWVWQASGHSVTSGTPLNQTSMFNSNILNVGSTFSFTFPNPGVFDYFCQPHGMCCGMVGKVTVDGTTPTPPPSNRSQPLNISTRMEVLKDDRVLIGGFIITGNDPKKVILRAIGPSLAGAGIANPLANPVLELHKENGTVTTNDNWKDTQQSAIEATGVAPENDLESAIVATLAPGNYTAVVSGKNRGTGVGLVEGYDLDQAADSQLANISTRGFVETESNVMIGGFILGPATGGSAKVLIRAIGPSLAQSGVSGALADPTLELRNENGTLVRSNDNWKDTQQTAIEATGIPPSNDLESALVATLNPGNYTAIVAGKNATTGVGLVEIYRLP